MTYNLFKNFNYKNVNNKLQKKLAYNTNSSTTVIAYKIIDKYINDKYYIDPDDRSRLSEIILNCITENYNVYHHDVVNYFLNRLVLSYDSKDNNSHKDPIKDIIDDYRVKLFIQLNNIYSKQNFKNLNQNSKDSVIFLSSSLSIIEISSIKK